MKHLTDLQNVVRKTVIIPTIINNQITTLLLFLLLFMNEL